MTGNTDMESEERCTRKRKRQAGYVRDDIIRLTELFVRFLLLGFFTFGGGLSMISVLEDKVVHRHKWLTEKEFLECITMSQVFPGVMAVNMATYVGKKVRGLTGAAAASIAVCIPSLIVILSLSQIILSLEDDRTLRFIIWGLKLGICGVTASTLLDLSKKFLKGIIKTTVAFGVFTAVFFLKVNPAYVVIVAAACNMIAAWLQMDRRRDG